MLGQLRPEATAEMSAELRQGVLLVSGTNGKTTTARLIRAALDASGYKVAANTAGSNLERGVATALLGAHSADMALFEVDEAALSDVSAKTVPRVVVLLNLFRDQLDRFGELDKLLEQWHQTMLRLPESTTVVYNADDPALAYIVANSDADHIRKVAFGVDDSRLNRKKLPHAADSAWCRFCGRLRPTSSNNTSTEPKECSGDNKDHARQTGGYVPLQYDTVTIGHLGRWSCPRCGVQRPFLDVAATKIELHGLSGQRISVTTPQGPREVSLRLPGLHNAYNALAAVACAHAIELDPEVVGPALAKRQAAFGRAERISIGQMHITTLLAKNPAGANENIHTMLATKQQLHLLLLLNDRTADGRDVSWIWDVDYELLLKDNRLGSLTVGGDRAYDMALRFYYGGFGLNHINVVPDIAAALDSGLAAAGPNGDLFVLPTYTALLEFQDILTTRGLVPAFWEDS